MLAIQSRIAVSGPKKIGRKTIADNGYTAIWFIYSNRWYDVGKFYDRKLTFVGYYCDIIRPVKRLLARHDRTVALTDLFLDLWIWPNNDNVILDEDELLRAEQKGIISRKLAEIARKQILLLQRKTKMATFPPAEICAMEPVLGHK